jgi:hypothetical protein
MNKSNADRNCNTCKFSIFRTCDTLKSNEEYQKIKDDDFLSTKKYEFKENFICRNYKSRYIEYPIEVSKIIQNTDKSGFRDEDIGKFVRISPCGKEYQEKTYLGLYLGELPVGFQITHNSETKELKVSFNINPAMFVFDLNKIIYGCESWWGFIESENDLKAITDADIENVWYVKALKMLSKGKESEVEHDA